MTPRTGGKATPGPVTRPGAGPAGHTPGPWRVYGSEIISGPSIDDAGHAVSVRIAEVWQRGDEATQANAALIASAPDILAHATQLLRDLEQDFTDTANELQAAYALRAAIRAAIGDTTMNADEYDGNERERVTDALECLRLTEHWLVAKEAKEIIYQDEHDLDTLREQVRALSAALELAEKFIHALPRPDVRKDFTGLNHMENGVLKPIRAALSLAAAESTGGAK